MRAVVESIEAEFRRYKAIGEGAMRQLSDAQLVAHAGEENLSVATLVRHLAGNLTSRFTDFLTTDGEKPWRDRDGEFVAVEIGRDELEGIWRAGWEVLLGALRELDDGHLERSVSIRGVPLTVNAALHRSLAHASYHVGQMVYVAKSLRGDDWQWLSIPPGGSLEYNKNPTREKAPS